MSCKFCTFTESIIGSTRKLRFRVGVSDIWSLCRSSDASEYTLCVGNVCIYMRMLSDIDALHIWPVGRLIISPRSLSRGILYGVASAMPEELRRIWREWVVNQLLRARGYADSTARIASLICTRRLRAKWKKKEKKSEELVTPALRKLTHFAYTL